MFVLFLSFVFLRISVCRTTESKNTPLKDQLQKSLTHVNDMLADIESKIEHERKLLSQIDYDLNYKERSGFMDYQVTDIWWTTGSHTSRHPTAIPPEGANATRTKLDVSLYRQPKQNTLKTKSAKREGDDPAISDIVSNWVLNANLSNRSDPSPRPGEPLPNSTHTSPTTVLTEVFTTPTLFPRPVPSTLPTPPPNWPFSSPPETTEKLFIQDMKKNMAADQHGYGSAFLAKLMELIATKDAANVTPLMNAMAAALRKLLEQGKFTSMGDSLTDGMRMLLHMMSTLRPSLLQQQAGVGHFVMKNKKALMSREMNSVIDYYDSLFTKEEGEELFASLEPFEKYPDGGKSAEEVSQRMLSATLAPYMRIEGTRNQKRLIQNINQAIQDLYPNWRAQSILLLDNSYTVTRHENNVATGHNHSAMPDRRSMSNKNIVKHFVVKHPQLFKMIKTRHLNKHNKKDTHYHKQKRHHNREKRQRHARLHEREQIRQRVYTESSNEPEHEVIAADTSGSGAYYHERSSAPQRNNKKNLHKIQRMKKQLQKLKHREYIKSKQKQRKLLYRARATTKPSKIINQKYLKQLAINSFRKRQRSQNFRRFIIPSLEENNSNNSEYFDVSMENHKLHKIIEASSYSDEENHLRNNLYDALRHGNRTYVKFRTSDDNNNPNQSLKHSSSETDDDEWVLKNNIYKVFEQNK